MNFDLPQGERWAGLWTDLKLVMPEVWLVLTMCVVILVPFIRRHIALPVVTTVVGLTLALLFVDLNASSFVFSGMLVIDPFSQFFKVLLLVFTLFIVVQWLIISRAGTSVLDVPDYLCLLVGAVVGMTLMASAANLVMIFIAMETASLPSFALAGFRKADQRSTEGSLKYVLFGAAASAVGLYGMSLIYASTGSLALSEIAGVAAAEGGFSPLLGLGMMAMLASVAFKLSAVPLHFWCPDVFEGAPIEITTFLSVASKGAAVCLLLRIVLAFGSAGAALGPDAVTFVGLATGVGILGGITATWGNLVALHQNNIKRMLAYSSIAHSGYMIMAVALAAIVGVESARPVTTAILFYLLIYMFMNLGAFTVAGLVTQQTGSEDIRDYPGLIRRSPAMAVLLALFLLSLFGMPGLGGFMGKIYVGTAMLEVGRSAGFLLIVVLFTNTVISLYYYLRPVYFMFFISDDPARPGFLPRPAGVAIAVICAAVLLWTGLLPQTAGNLAAAYADILAIPPQTSSADAGLIRPVDQPVLWEANPQKTIDR